MAFLEFAHILWETSKPTIVLMDNKSVTGFFQTKAIPPSLWNACDYVMQFNSKKAHIAGSDNTAADFLSRLELKVTEKIHLKIREVVRTKPIEVSTSSSDVGDEEQFFFMQAVGEDETEEQVLQRKEQSQKKAAEWVVKLGTVLNEAKYQTIHKDRRKHYVVFHPGNQSKCKNRSRAGNQSSSKKSEIQNTWRTTCWCAIENGQTV